MANEIELASSGTIATAKPTFSLKSLNLAQKCPAVVVAPTGAKLSKYPFPKIKFEEGRRVRIAILTEEVMMVKLHYHPEVGYILCDGGACCNYCDKVSVKYCYPCVVYETSEAGKPISTKIDLKLLVLGGELYDQISLLSEVSGSITNMDLIFTCTSTQYQKCSATQAGPALWLTNEDSVKFVNEYMEANCDKMLDALGKTYTAEELANKLGDMTASADQKCLSPAEIASVYNVNM